ncbi:MAG: DMT family transporter [Clostridia bacterium]
MLLTASLIWGLAFSLQRQGTQFLDAISFNGLRFIIAGFTLIPVIFLFDFFNKKRGNNHIGWNKSTILGGVFCGVLIFIGNNLQQMGLQTTTAGKASFISALYIVIVPLIGMFMRKKTAMTGWFAVLIAIAGFWTMSVNDNFEITDGDILVLLCAFIFAFHITVIGIFAEDADPIRLTFLQFFVASALSVPTMAINGFPTGANIEACILPLLYVGILSSGLGFTLQTMGQQRTDASTATLLLSLESVFGLFGGIIILHEQATPKELLGCILVFLAVILAEQKPYHKFLQFKNCNSKLLRCR